MSRKSKGPFANLEDLDIEFESEDGVERPRIQPRGGSDDAIVDDMDASGFTIDVDRDSKPNIEDVEDDGIGAARSFELAKALVRNKFIALNYTPEAAVLEFERRYKLGACNTVHLARKHDLALVAARVRARQR